MCVLGEGRGGSQGPSPWALLSAFVMIWINNMLIKFKENIKLGGSMNTSENKGRSSVVSQRLWKKGKQQSEIQVKNKLDERFIRCQR